MTQQTCAILANRCSDICRGVASIASHLTTVDSLIT